MNETLTENLAIAALTDPTDPNAPEPKEIGPGNEEEEDPGKDGSSYTPIVKTPPDPNP